MKISILISAFMLVGVTYCNAQQVDSLHSKRIKWVNSFQMGAIIDSNNGLTGRMSTSYQSGLNYSNWTLSAGVGIDDYEQFIIIPALIELKFAFLIKNNMPYVYALGAYNFVKQKSDEEIYKYNDGLGFGGGVGYEWSLGFANVFIKSGIQHTEIKSERQQIYYDVWYSNQFYPQTPQEITRNMIRAKFFIGINF